jgi:hypothetical protein
LRFAADQLTQQMGEEADESNLCNHLICGRLARVQIHSTRSEEARKIKTALSLFAGQRQSADLNAFSERPSTADDTESLSKNYLLGNLFVPSAAS